MTEKPLSQSEQWSIWAEAAQKGDSKSYNALLRDILPVIRRTLVGKLANPEWAEDIAQEVLLSVHKALPTYSPKRSFRPWLMAIVNFRYTDFLRKHYAHKDNEKLSLDAQEFEHFSVTNPTHAGEYKDVEEALSILPPKQRRIVELIRIEGYTAPEVADQMKMSLSAVKVSLHRSTKRIKEKLSA